MANHRDLHAVLECVFEWNQVFGLKLVNWREGARSSMGVTRAAVYNWFSGGTVGKAAHVAAIKSYLGLEDTVD